MGSNFEKRLAVNGIPVRDDESYDQINESIAGIKSGQSLMMTIFRQGQVLRLSIQPSH